MSLDHLWDLKKLRRTIFNYFGAILDKNLILKKKVSKIVKNDEKSHISEISNVGFWPISVEMWPVRSAQNSSLAEIFYIAQLQKLRTLAQKNIPPPKRPFFWGVKLHVHLIQQ